MTVKKDKAKMYATKDIAQWHKLTNHLGATREVNCRAWIVLKEMTMRHQIKHLSSSARIFLRLISKGKEQCATKLNISAPNDLKVAEYVNIFGAFY